MSGPTAYAKEPRPGRSAFVALLLGTLGLQLALHPFLSKRFTPPAASKTTLVAACEFCKICLAAALLSSSGAAPEIFRTWTLRSSLVAAGLPAALYAAQNVCLQHAYACLTPTKFQLLNQTKVFWSALLSFLFLGRRQSRLGCVSLALLLAAAAFASWPNGGKKPMSTNGSPTPLAEEVPACLFGVATGLSAAFLSGLASTVSQWTLQGGQRNVFLFGGEMAVYTIATLVIGAPLSGWLSVESSFRSWAPPNLIPIFSCAAGGFLVGLVTKFAGNIAKGYAIVGGIVMTGLLDGLLNGASSISWRLWVAAPLVAASIMLRAACA